MCKKVENGHKDSDFTLKCIYRKVNQKQMHSNG